MSIAVQVVCDGCGKSVSCGSGKDRKHAHQVRSKLRDEGWSIDWTPHGDLCGACRSPSKRVGVSSTSPEMVNSHESGCRG